MVVNSRFTAMFFVQSILFTIYDTWPDKPPTVIINLAFAIISCRVVSCSVWRFPENTGNLLCVSFRFSYICPASGCSCRTDTHGGLQQLEKDDWHIQKEVKTTGDDRTSWDNLYSFTVLGE